MDLHFPRPPTCSMSPAGIFLNLLGNATFESSIFSIEPTSNPLSFAFNCTLTFTARLSPDGSKIELQMEEIALSDMKQDGVNFAIIEGLLKSILKEHLNPLVFTEELPLVDGLVLKNPKMTLRDGYVVISSDLAWTQSG